MKRLHLPRQPQLSLTASSILGKVTEEIRALWSERRKYRLPLYLFLASCLNLILATAVYAAAAEDVSRSQAYWMVALGMVTVALCVYLFVVMFAPERF